MRNRFVDLKRLVLPGAIYFVTIKTKHNFPYFRERVFCDLFVEELKWCKRIKEFRLFAWFLGYDHFHLLVQPNDKWNISDVMHCLKRHFSRNANIILGYTKFQSRNEYSSVVGADGHPRLLPMSDVIPMENGANVDNGTNDDRIGEMMDIFTIRQQIRFIAKYGNQHPFPKFGWQKSLIDRRARNENELDRIWEYIRINPIKHAMPPGWPYVFENPKFANLLDYYGLN